MNVVNRVRKKFEKQPIKSLNYGEGYVDALNDVQVELGKEVAYDWEAEINRLKQKHECEIKELTREHEYEDAESDAFLQSAKHELEIYKAKWEAVELIFGCR